ncbi:MAG TPA: NAD(P)-dependent oxidoreductase [Acidimicrobiales bacterium]|nr:NAD(P)-dependent oxidoreductase [Acidimicrobiales bacterium]
MRVLVIGATGAIGTRLVPQLKEAGHDVIGTSRSREKAVQLRSLGAEPVVLDALDAEAVRRTFVGARPEAVIYQATALADLSDLKNFDASFSSTNKLRTEGVDIMLAAADEAGVSRIVAQSYASHRYARVGGPVKSEEDPLDLAPPHPQSLAAMAHTDQAVTAAGGVALRYGAFYGDPADALASVVRAGQFPVIGDGAGIWSHVHLEDAASATVLALQHAGPAIYNIVDDDPAPTGVWLPELAKILGAPPPPQLSESDARALAGETMVIFGTESRGASNAKAKAELGWALRYPSWRQGFVATYGQARLDKQSA